MTVQTLARDDRRNVCTDTGRRPARCDGLEALEKSDIGALSATAINKLTCDELVRMIRVANLPAQLRSDLDWHLPFYDHAVLTRLAHLAQRCCRNQGKESLGKDAE